MVYNALIEFQFSENIEQAKKQIKEEDYGNVANSLNQAKGLIEKLPHPQNLSEKIQYLELKSDLYKKLSDTYILASNRGPLIESDIEKEKDLIKSYLEDIVGRVKDLGSTLSRDETHKCLGTEPNLQGTLLNLRNLLKDYSDRIEKYTEEKQEEVTNELLDELRDPVAKLAGVMGVTIAEPIKDIEDVPWVIEECASKLEDLMKV